MAKGRANGRKQEVEQLRGEVVRFAEAVAVLRSRTALLKASSTAMKISVAAFHEDVHDCRAVVTELQATRAVKHR